MGGCEKCCKVSAWIFLVVGVLFLLSDLGMWSFFNIKWYTALFVIVGLVGVAQGTCKACQAAGSSMKGKR